ncbi:hypothetical protein, partial [Halomonas sp. C05BenzN]|uniref:hypothetical protein n=1 Tax=Halomonas sp. C05BenzN TaxID=3411041 RepID=UPI003B95433A
AMSPWPAAGHHFMSGREQDAVASTRIDYTGLDPFYETAAAFRGSLCSQISDLLRLYDCKEDCLAKGHKEPV